MANKLNVRRITPAGLPGTFIVVIDETEGMTRYEVFLSNTGGSATANYSRINRVRNATRPFINVRRHVAEGPTLDKLLKLAREAVATK